MFTRSESDWYGPLSVQTPLPLPPRFSSLLVEQLAKLLILLIALRIFLLPVE